MDVTNGGNICQNLSNSTLKMGAFYCMELYLNKLDPPPKKEISNSDLVLLQKLAVESTGSNHSFLLYIVQMCSFIQRLRINLKTVAMLFPVFKVIK